MTDQEKARARILAQTGGYWGYWPGLLDILCDGLLAVVRAEQARIAGQFHERYHDAPCVDIGKSEVQAFLDARCVHNGVPEPPR